MSRRAPKSGTGTRLGSVGRLIGATLATFALATTVYAEMTPIEPDHGTVSPGDSTSAHFVLEPPPDPLLGIPLASCVLASVSPNPGKFSVTFDGLGLGLLPANCSALGSSDVEVTVEAGASAEPGDYTLTITEVLHGLGDLVSTRDWSFTVEGTSTTTTSSTTTSSTTTTSTSSTTSTTTPVDTTPTSAPTTVPSGETTTTLGVTTTEGVVTSDSPVTTTGPAGPTTSVSHETSTSGREPLASEGDDDDPNGLAPGGSDAGTGDPVPEAAAPTGDSGATIPITEQLTARLSDAVTPGVARAVMSPLVIAEFLFRSIISSAAGYAIPLLVALLLSAGLVWRMRGEVTDDELSLE